MEEDLYDEFGNYIGPELNDDEDIEIKSEDIESEGHQDEEHLEQQIIPHQDPSQIVLYEDKKYYPELEEVY